MRNEPGNPCLNHSCLYVESHILCIGCLKPLLHEIKGTIRLRTYWIDHRHGMSLRHTLYRVREFRSVIALCIAPINFIPEGFRPNPQGRLWSVVPLHQTSIIQFCSIIRLHFLQAALPYISVRLVRLLSTLRLVCARIEILRGGSRTIAKSRDITSEVLARDFAQEVETTGLLNSRKRQNTSTVQHPS